MKEFVLPNDSRTDLNRLIDSFVNENSLVRLVNAFGGRYETDNDIEKLRYLLSFSDRWDYRGKAKAKTENNEQARWLVESDVFSTEQIECLEYAKNHLGLINNSVPKSDEYDYIWILGGAKLSCLLRTRLASEIVSKLNCPPKKVSLLGSFRPINDSERLATDTYAPGAGTEFDLFVSAHDIFFSRCGFAEDYENNQNPNLSWCIREYEDGVSVLSAPSSEPDKRRANSLDTYQFFGHHYDVKPQESVLLVTSEIYVPYQHLEAFRSIVLEKNIRIETVGFPAEWGGELQGMTTNENYLQEIRSTIQSLNRLVNTLCWNN